MQATSFKCYLIFAITNWKRNIKETWGDVMGIEKYPIQQTHIDNAPSRPLRKSSRKGWCLSLKIIYLTIVVTVFFLKPLPAVSENIRCSCTPLKFRWNLNFTNPCPTANIAPNRGVKAPFCDIDVDVSTTRNVVDSIPVVVTSYLLVELDAGSAGSIERNNNASLKDGHAIEFVSATMANQHYISRGLFIEIVGRNALDEKVELSISIDFTNICEQPPFLFGDSIGWITYAYDQNPVFRPETCFRFPAKPPTRAPTHQPSRTKTKRSNKKKVSKKSIQAKNPKRFKHLAVRT